MPLFSRSRYGASPVASGAQRRTSRRPSAHTLCGGVPAIGSTELGEQLEGFAARRGQFLSCSGMHTAEVREIVRSVCEGKVKGPGIAYVAPALYEGIPGFLDKTMDVQAELAVYASLYMGLVAVAGYTGHIPGLTEIGVTMYYNGVFSSMFCFSGVVLIAILYRLAAVGHLRESDKLLYLWRARYAPVICVLLFLVGLFGACYALMRAVGDTVAYGGACFASIGDPTMQWDDWWNQWVYPDKVQYGAGVVHPKGEPVLNPWMVKANELNITAPTEHTDVGYHQGLREQYNEFMRDHFGFFKTCEPQQALHEHYGGFMSGDLYYQWMVPYLIIGTAVPFLWAFLWLSPTRHILYYWLAQARARCRAPSLLLLRVTACSPRSPRARPGDTRSASSASSASTSSARSRTTRSTILTT